MKQQNHQDERGIYPQLRAEFQITEEQKQRIAARIRARANADTVTEPVAKAAVQEPIRKTKHNQECSGIFAMRFLPLAACLLLAVGAGFFMLRNHNLTQEPEQVSRTDLAEQTTTAASETTLCLTDSTRSETRQSSTTDHTTTSAAVSGTAETQTESAQTTSATVSGTTQTISSPTTAPTTASTAAASESSEAPETTASGKIGTDPAYPADICVILLENRTAHPGETVTVQIVQANAYTYAGIELHFKAESGGAPMPEIEAESAFQPDGCDVICSEFGGNINFIMVSAKAEAVPAGTVLCTLECTIPADAAPGTVYRFVQSEACRVSGTETHDTHQPELRLGSITVIA